MYTIVTTLIGVLLCIGFLVLTFGLMIATNDFFNNRSK